MDTTYLTLGLALIALGVLLLLADLFVMSGAMAALAIVVIVVGLVFVFRYDSDVGFVTAGGLFVGVPIAGYLVIRLFPAMGLWQNNPQSGSDTIDSMRGLKGLAELKGRYGKTLSALRPAGVADFDGRRIDCISEGMLIEAGQSVRCVEVRMGTVVVRLSDPSFFEDVDPDLLD